MSLAPHELGLVVAPLEQHDGGVGLSFWTRRQLAPALEEPANYVSTLNELAENLSNLTLQPLSVVFLPGIYTRVKMNQGG